MSDATLRDAFKVALNWNRESEYGFHQCGCQDQSRITLNEISVDARRKDTTVYHYGCGRCGSYWHEDVRSDGAPAAAAAPVSAAEFVDAGLERDYLRQRVDALEAQLRAAPPAKPVPAAGALKQVAELRSRIALRMVTEREVADRHKASRASDPMWYESYRFAAIKANTLEWVLLQLDDIDTATSAETRTDTEPKRWCNNCGSFDIATAALRAAPPAEETTP